MVWVDGATAVAWSRDIIAHGYRLMRPAQATACMLGLSQERQDRLGLAALVHDLGKIAIPTAILHKPGPLTDEEWVLVRRHPEIGYYMLWQAGGEGQYLAPLVLAHHERWDGNGYPNGWAKDAIPLEARILSVVDAYDAMISPRVYRKSLTPEEARAELERCAGHQFDPQVVAAFFRVLDEPGPAGHTIPQMAFPSTPHSLLGHHGSATSAVSVLRTRGTAWRAHLVRIHRKPGLDLFRRAAPLRGRFSRAGLASPA